ncbi:NAD(P)-dependent oxidoreductase [Streptomyces kanamyceticus]|uniref:NAD-dependent epimerase/dehydratase family protein n=1 Tax=Streptomyces kanamyceticus TaxID=1967 RepID=A0A5J6GGB0_STRKN|nr:NAD(P)H-binding protein [Streptomyces kanamyceticus]QEU94047.1 NAD-dependent epimerase/dehydratase family protein [Streptomyces kanamyceticus]
MRITVFGAAGNSGSRVVTEALSRGHEVTAVVRDAARFADLHPDATHRTGDAGVPDDVRRLSAGQDLVVNATRPAPGREAEHPAITRSLLAGLAGTGVRLLVIGGAGSLTVPGTEGVLAIDDPRYVPAAWRHIAAASNAQYDEVRTTETDVAWTYLSPSALFEPGTRTGEFRLAKDEILVDTEGNSAISMEDFAIALLDEAERPEHHRGRFTVGY